MDATVQILRDHLRSADWIVLSVIINRCSRIGMADGCRAGESLSFAQPRAGRAASLPGFTQSVSPHSLRHTKGMHLLQSGVSLEIIRDFLGHVDVKTTQIYAKANLEMKRRALEKVTDAPLPTMPSWQQNRTLLDWLHSL